MWHFWHLLTRSVSFKQLGHCTDVSSHDESVCQLSSLSLENDVSIHFYSDMTVMTKIHSKAIEKSMAVCSLVDTGCQRSVVSHSLISKLQLDKHIHPPKIKTFRLASGKEVSAIGHIVLIVHIAKVPYKFTFHVLPKLQHHLILGADFLSYYQASIDFTDNTLHFSNTTPFQNQISANIPPGELKFIPLRCTKPDLLICNGLNGIVCVSDHSDRLKITPTICTLHNDTVHIPVANITNRSMTVNIGDLRGDFTPMSIESMARYTDEDSVADTFGISDQDMHASEHFEQLYDKVFVNSVSDKPIIYDKYNCGWKNENLTDFEPQEGATYTTPSTPYHTFDISDTIATGKHKQGIRALLRHNKSAFIDSTNKIGFCTLFPARIHLKPGSTPKQIRPFRVPFHQRDALQKAIDNLRQEGIIEPCNFSLWIHPIFAISKVKGSSAPEHLRVLSDTRYLNQCILRPSYACPLIPNVLDNLAKAQSIIYCCLDLKSGFFQQSLHVDDRHLTAFRAPDSRLYNYTRSLQGCSSSPVYFNELMSRVLKEAQDVCEVYFDDCLLHTKSVPQMFPALSKVLRLAIKHNIKFSPAKSRFFVDSVDFVGHHIQGQKMSIAEKHIKAITNFSRPRNVKSLRQLLGVINFVNQFLSKKAAICRPLTELLKKNTKYKWNDNCEEAFMKLKKMILSRPFLMLPNFGKDFQLRTDSSSLGLGASLTQPYKEGPRAVAYFSRTLRKYEQCYCSYDLEFLGVIEALAHFDPYLIGRHFVIFVDNRALVTLLTQQKASSARSLRWMQRLLRYSFDVVWVPGSTNIVPDSLSRNPDPTNTTPLNMDEHGILAGLAANDSNHPSLDPDQALAQISLTPPIRGKVTPSSKIVHLPNGKPIDVESLPCIDTVSTHCSCDDVFTYTKPDLIPLSDSDDIPEITNVDAVNSDLENKQDVIQCIEKSINQYMFEEDIMPGINVTTRAQANQQKLTDEETRKREIRFLQDLPVIGKHLYASHIFDKNGNLRDENDSTNISKPDNPSAHHEDNSQQEQIPPISDDEDITQPANSQQERPPPISDDDNSARAAAQAEETTGEAIDYDIVDANMKVQIQPSRHPLRLRHAEEIRLHDLDALWKDDKPLGFTMDELHYYQRLDTNTNDLLQYLLHDILPRNARRCRHVILREFTSFVHDGILYQISENNKTQTIKTRIWVPKGLQIRSIKMVHVSSGHMGINKTIYLLRERFLFPQMLTLTKRCITSCEFCQLNKINSKALTCYSSLYDVTPAPFDYCHIDFIGRFDRDNNGFSYIMSLIDRQTNYCILVPLSNLTTETVMKAINKHLISYFGCPKNWVTDNGSPWNSNIYKDLQNHLNFKTIKISSNLSQSNGLVENLQKLVTYSLKGMVAKYKHKWSSYLYLVQLFLNNTCTQNNSTPQTKMTGEPANLPFDLINDKPIPEEAPAREFIQARLTEQQHAREAAMKFQRLRALQRKEKHDANLHTKPKILEPGCIVYRRLKHTKDQKSNKKLQQLCDGPYILLNVNSRNACTIKHFYTSKVHPQKISIRHLSLPSYFRGEINTRENVFKHLDPVDRTLLFRTERKHLSDHKAQDETDKDHK